MPDITSSNSISLSRRQLLSAVSAASVLSLTRFPGQAFAAEIELPDFLALSQNLVGQDDLSEDIASAMLQAFTESGSENSIAALAAGEEDEDTANAIVEAWYTGVSPNPDDLQVLTYSDALLWNAMDYTKPMAVCGGGVGYWAEPPEA